MLSSERASKWRAQGGRKAQGQSRSPYHATVQTWPVWRVGSRQRSREYRPSQEPRSAQRTSAHRAHKARPLNLFAQLQAWWRQVLTVTGRSRPRRSQVRLGQKERPQRHTTIWTPVLTAWQVGGYTAINILFLVLVGWALFWFFSDAQFYISHIEVRGNQRVSSEAIVAASGLQNYSIFWVNPPQVSRQVSAALPPVRRVHVQYSLPNRVTLVVEEQGGQVMWQVGGTNYWVDDDGRLHPVQGEATPSLIVQDIRPGVPEMVDPQAVLAAQQLLELLPEIKTLGYAPTTGLRFRHPRGWEVYLGTDEMARKVNILRAIEQQFAGEDTPQPSLVDLRFPDSPYYRLPDENGA